MAGSDSIRVVILDDYEGMAATVPAFEKLKQRADVVVMRTRLKNEAELANALREAQVVLLMRERTALGEKELGVAPALRHIAQTGKTSIHLDLKTATRRGISISMTGSDSGTSTVELTIALMLSVLRQIPLVDRRMRQEAWPAIPGRLMEGKTVGLVGLGRIGTEVARVCRALNAKIVATSRTLTY
jgi:phosphoglycerate dehydrogenase-like enzyme